MFFCMHFPVCSTMYLFTHPSVYLSTAKAIDEFIAKRVEALEKEDAMQDIDPRLEHIVERMFDR